MAVKPENLSQAQRAELLADFRDHAAFCRESLSIRDLSGSVVPFELYPGPLKLNRMIRAQQRRGKPVRLVVLKTRRSFFTAGSCAEMFHDVGFYAGKKGLVIADKYKPAGLEAFDYLLQYQRRYKPFTREGCAIRLPRLIKDSAQAIEWERGNSIDVLSADSGEVRGGGRHFILCDEVAFWRNAAVTLTGVLNMVPYLPETTVIVQSTANGIGGEFYELCQRAQDPANQGGWEFLFFGWLEHPVYQIALDEAAAVKVQRSLNPEEIVLQRQHGATLEQLAWRRKTIELECRGSVDVFNQEYPTTALDAFLASGRPAFEHKAIQRMPVSAGTPGELELYEDGPQKRLRFIVGDRGALTIWKKPEAGKLYIIGADPSKGKDASGDKRGNNPDYSVGFIADSDTGEQVGLLRGRIRPASFAQYLVLVAKWFRHAYIVPEANDAGFIDALIQTGYPLECIYNRQRDPTDKRSARPEEIGFETTTLTRSWLVSAADEAIRTMGITIRSGIVAQECRTFVIKPNGKKEAQDNCHDDCVIAMALAAIGMRYAPKARNAFANKEEKQYGVQKVGWKLRGGDDDEDERDHPRSFRSW